MRCCMLCAALLAMLLPRFVHAADDPAKLPETMLKQPIYKTAGQRYALLVFGKQAERKIWLVLDGKTLYADLNGNGDLTEAGEAFPTNGSNSYQLSVPAWDKSPTAATLSLSPDYRDASRYRLRLRRGAQYQFVGIGVTPRAKFSKTPQTAPVLHFDGPLTLARYSTVVTIPRNAANSSRSNSLRIVIGTPGIREGAFACHHFRCAKTFGPLVGDFVYRDAAGLPIRVKHELKQSG